MVMGAFGELCRRDEMQALHALAELRTRQNRNDDGGNQRPQHPAVATAGATGATTATAAAAAGLSDHDDGRGRDGLSRWEHAAEYEHELGGGGVAEELSELSGYEGGSSSHGSEATEAAADLLSQVETPTVTPTREEARGGGGGGEGRRAGEGEGGSSWRGGAGSSDGGGGYTDSRGGGGGGGGAGGGLEVAGWLMDRRVHKAEIRLSRHEAAMRYVVEERMLRLQGGGGGGGAHSLNYWESTQADYHKSKTFR